MWHTPEGDRRLTGAEAELVRRALATIADRLAENLSCGDGGERVWDSGVAMFDELTVNQQLVVIAQVAEHLLRDTPDTLELTAVNEAAAYAVFATVAEEIDVEISMADDPRTARFGPRLRTFWRQRVLDAVGETLAGDQARGTEEAVQQELPSAECADLATWTMLTERLADRILWDRDFEMGDTFLDSDPAKSAMMKQIMGIESNYYIAIADEPAEDEAAALLESVRQITDAQ